MADGIAENDGCHGGQKKIYIYINSLKLKKTRGLNRKKKKKLWCQIGKKIKMGLSKVKKGCQLAKGKKSCRHKKGVSNSKNKTKKKLQLAHHFAKAAMFTAFVRVVAAIRAGACRRRSCRCSSPPFMPVLIAAVGSSLLAALCVRGVAAGCGASLLGAGVELLVGGGLHSY